MLKKIFSAGAALLAAACIVNGAEVTARASGKNASVRELSPGVWQLEVAPGKGWFQIQFAQKVSGWGGGKWPAGAATARFLILVDWSNVPNMETLFKTITLTVK